MVSRPASMRLAMAISPSRYSNSTEPISRKYMRTGSSVRSSTSSPLGLGDRARGIVARRPLVSLAAFVALALAFGIGLIGLDDIDAHLGQHRHRVFDLLGVGRILRAAPR